MTDTAALPSVEVDSDHKLMYVAFKASPCSRDSDLREGEPETVYKETRPKKLLVAKLKDEEKKKEFVDTLNNELQRQEGSIKGFSAALRSAGESVLGERKC